ncbi:flagellar motor protein MotA [Hyphomicrobium sp. LHD-15]|uniref:flagellar motor protein MotA n=1 Tax=Hyphomicrobium sp. LHD-15 TaxID=3072142 RepID=UPI00280E91B2|nr:flagellar motor protein MotA [Hyphomicrobium sp. LHD-15]MDQ8697876.1 flagellar motor protein MotA [Hyphomicrobium sp. LHD-15]
MARKRPEITSGTSHRTLTPPGVFLVRMLVFLTLVAFLAAILHERLEGALMTNPGLNGLILGVLFLGIIYAFRQVIRLYPEIRFVNAFRISDPGLASTHQPVLLAPMATMLRDRTGALSLSTVSMRTIMDSIGSRLDEARDTGRYMVGLLVFLGLLGTFWGLLETIQSVGLAINTLSSTGETVAVFDELKSGLAAPLKGMGTAFSSSLLGLSGSLVLGFLELQASHAHNRFYNELEEWLSGITELTPGSSSATEQVSRQLMAAVFEMQRAVEDLSGRMKGGSSSALGVSGGSDEPVRDLARGVNQLVTQMRAEQKVVREWVDEQATQQSEVTNVLRDLAQNMLKRGS